MLPVWRYAARRLSWRCWRLRLRRSARPDGRAHVEPRPSASHGTTRDRHGGDAGATTSSITQTSTDLHDHAHRRRHPADHHVQLHAQQRLAGHVPQAGEHLDRSAARATTYSGPSIVDSRSRSRAAPAMTRSTAATRTTSLPETRTATRSTAPAASTSTSARRAPTRSSRATASPERIACGADADLVDNDFIDIIAECERGTDNDVDGFSTAVDCNDGARNIFPGAPDPENGIDEDCNGQDNRNLDRDRDGFPVPGRLRRRQRRRSGRTRSRSAATRRRELRPPRRSVRRAAVARLHELEARRGPSRVCAGWSSATRRPGRVGSASACAGPGARCAGRAPSPSGATSPRCSSRASSAAAGSAPERPHHGRGDRRPERSAAPTRTGIERGVLPLADIVCRAPGARRGTQVLTRAALLRPARRGRCWPRPPRTRGRVTSVNGRAQLPLRPRRRRQDRRLRDRRPASASRASGRSRSARTRAARSSRGDPEHGRLPEGRRAPGRPPARRRRRRRHGERRRSPCPVDFRGDAGNDGLFGGGGPDKFNGGSGNDNIVARDGGPRTSTAATASTPPSPTTPTTASRARRSRATPTATACAGRPTATTPSRRSGRASSTSPTTGSTRTARASTRSTSTATATASPGRRTATTPTAPSSPACGRSSATRPTRTATR